MAALVRESGGVVRDRPPVSNKIPIIGLAGGVGSGKSLVAQMMGELGAIVLDADEAAHDVLAQPQVVASLTEWWGASVVGPRGEVDRKRVSEIVFEDPKQRRRLEALIHPRIFERWARTIQQARDDQTVAPAVVIDAPLLFEAGLDAECDVIVFVDVPVEVRSERVRANRGWSDEELRRREKMQQSLEAKKAKADYVIENASSVADLHRRVERLFATVTGSSTSS
jgi:dephospho-CoA kinase